MAQEYNPLYTGNQWYLPINTRKLYNPRCKTDLVSRQTWYDNVTYPDLITDMKFRRKIAMRKYPNMNLTDIQLFLTTCPPEYK
jgi:hypothetical protein